MGLIDRIVQAAVTLDGVSDEEIIHELSDAAKLAAIPRDLLPAIREKAFARLADAVLAATPLGERGEEIWGQAPRRYWVPAPRGWVRDVTYQPGTLGPQVCSALAGGGSCLESSREGLLALVRREAAAAERAWERRWAGYV